MGAEAGGHTLSTTAVVHEAYLWLIEQTRTHLIDRGQCFAVAARTIRRVLVDYARQHQAQRRGGPQRTAVALETLEREGSAAISVTDRAESIVAHDRRLLAAEARQ